MNTSTTPAYTVNCGGCGGEVTGETTVCPHCGSVLA